MEKILESILFLKKSYTRIRSTSSANQFDDLRDENQSHCQKTAENYRQSNEREMSVHLILNYLRYRSCYQTKDLLKEEKVSDIITKQLPETNGSLTTTL